MVGKEIGAGREEGVPPGRSAPPGAQTLSSVNRELSLYTLHMPRKNTYTYITVLKACGEAE